MSFSGKRFRRVRTENVDLLLKVTNANEHMIRALQSTTPVFSFTRVDENSFTFLLQSDERCMTHTFRLDEETEMERRDGSKVKVTYSLEGDNVLKQVIRTPDGKTSYFRREFSDKETKMIITIDGVDVAATIYYEVVD